MKKDLLVGTIVGLLVMLMLTVGACSGGTDVTTTSPTDLPVTSSTEAITTTSSTTTTTSLPPGVFETSRHEENARPLTYSGTWKTSSSSSASGGSFVFVDAENAAVTVRFIGTQLFWVAKTSPRYGIAEVTVDGTSVGNVDLYSAEEAWQQVVWQSDVLTLGPHTVTIAWTGDKDPEAEQSNINLDAIEVHGALTSRYQQTNEKIVYAGDWKASSNPSASGENFAFANSAGASVTVRFKGIQLAWLAKTSPAYGEAQVTIDGGSPTTVDLYSEEALWKQEVWNSGLLGSGSHTVVIQWTGRRNAAATDTNINVDYFDVTGVLE